MPVRFHLGLATFDLIMRQSHSLKDKRRIVSGLKDRMKTRLGVSVAESAQATEYNRAFMAVACIGSDRSYVERTLLQARNMAETRDGAEVWNWTLEWL